MCIYYTFLYMIVCLGHGDQFSSSSERTRAHLIRPPICGFKPSGRAATTRAIAVRWCSLLYAWEHAGWQCGYHQRVAIRLCCAQNEKLVFNRMGYALCAMGSQSHKRDSRNMLELINSMELTHTAAAAAYFDVRPLIELFRKPAFL